MTGLAHGPDDLLGRALSMLEIPARPVGAEPSLASVLRDQADALARVATLPGDLGLAHAGIERLKDAGDESGPGFLGALVVGPVLVGDLLEVGHRGEASTSGGHVTRHGLGVRPLTCPSLGHTVGP